MKYILKTGKISALFLIVTLLLSLLPVGAFGAVGEDVITVSEEVGVSSRDLLMGLDMLEMPAADLSEGMTRSNFALLLAEMMRYTGFTTPDAGYRDIESGMANAAAMGFAIEQGYMVGERGLFRPDDGVTFAEAARAFVELTGNNLNRRIKTESAYAAKASGLGITKGVSSKNGKAVLSAGAAYKLAANTLSAKSMKMAAISGAYVSEIETDNFLTLMHDVKRVSGILTKAQYAGLYSSSGTGGKTVEIDQVRFLAEEDWTDFLGYKVTAFIDYGGLDAEVLHMVPTDDNEIFELKAEDILSVSEQKNKITYVSPEDEEEEEFMNLGLGTMVVWNGAYGGTLVNFEAYELALRSAKGDPKTGTVRLIDHDGDNLCDVMVITSYEIYYTNTVDHHKERIIDESGKIFEMNQYADQARNLSYESGSETTFDVFDKELIIHIAESRDKKRVTAIIGETSLEATITGVRDGREFCVDGVWYTGNDYFVENYTDIHKETADNLAVGWHGYFLLDVDGRIAAIQPQSAARYGYLVGLSTPNGLGTETQAKIFTDYKTSEEGAYEMVIFNLAPSVRVDKGAGLGFEPVAENKIKDLAVFKKPNGNFNHQLIRYTVNNADDIVSIQAADQTGAWSGEDFLEGRADDSRWFNDYAEFALSYDATDGGRITTLTADNALDIFKGEGDYTNAIYFARTFVMDKRETKLWVIPPEESLNEDKFYDCAEFGDYSLGSYPNVKVYDLKKEGSASHVVWQASGATGGTVKWEAWKTLLVTDTQEVLNSDGDVTTEITGYRNTRYSNEKMAIISLTSKDNNLLKNLKKGDFIQYDVDTRNNVTAVRRLFSYVDGKKGYASDNPLKTSPRPTGSPGFTSIGVPYWGKILYHNLNGTTIAFSHDLDGLPVPYGKACTAFTKTNYFEWIVYDTKTEKAWLDKEPTTYGITDVANPEDATDCLVLAGGNYGMGMGVLYIK